MTLERDKDAAVFWEINKSSAMAMISGDDMVQDALYKLPSSSFPHKKTPNRLYDNVWLRKKKNLIQFK